MKKTTILRQHLENLSAAQTFEDFKAEQVKYVQFLVDMQDAEDRFKGAAYEWVVRTNVENLMNKKTEKPDGATASAEPESQ